MKNKFIKIADKMSNEMNIKMQVILDSTGGYMIFPASTPVPKFPLYSTIEVIYVTGE